MKQMTSIIILPLLLACTLFYSGKQARAESVTLEWIAPGEKTADVYYMGYSTDSSALGGEDLNCQLVCDTVTGLPLPLTPGTIQSIEITGLDYDTRYYFRMKAAYTVIVSDGSIWYNWSGGSNIVSWVTDPQPPPQIITTLRILP